jgi:hypothetical protein
MDDLLRRLAVSMKRGRSGQEPFQTILERPFVRVHRSRWIIPSPPAAAKGHLPASRLHVGPNACMDVQ